MPRARKIHGAGELAPWSGAAAQDRKISVMKKKCKRELYGEGPSDPFQLSSILHQCTPIGYQQNPSLRVALSRLQEPGDLHRRPLFDGSQRGRGRWRTFLATRGAFFSTRFFGFPRRQKQAFSRFRGEPSPGEIVLDQLGDHGRRPAIRFTHAEEFAADKRLCRARARERRKAL